jgi:hypothetical protein
LDAILPLYIVNDLTIWRISADVLEGVMTRVKALK